LWTGILAPAGTPQPVLSRLHAEIVHAIGQSDVKEALARQGAVPASSTPQEFSAYMKAELAKWARVVKEANVKPH
ncbi:MAG: tripartite tricarboxylate transporter substrate-binding protein, partial [Burkholderiales bacterium]